MLANKVIKAVLQLGDTPMTPHLSTPFERCQSNSKIYY